MRYSRHQLKQIASYAWGMRQCNHPGYATRLWMFQKASGWTKQQCEAFIMGLTL